MAGATRIELAKRYKIGRTSVAKLRLNQAVAQLNATGEPPVWLEHAVDRSMRAVDEVDAVVSRIHRRLT